MQDVGQTAESDKGDIPDTVGVQQIGLEVKKTPLTSAHEKKIMELFNSDEEVAEVLYNYILLSN